MVKFDKACNFSVNKIIIGLIGFYYLKPNLLLKPKEVQSCFLQNENFVSMLKIYQGFMLAAVQSAVQVF